MRDFLAGTAGIAIILIVATDIFRSLLVPRASARVLRVGPLLSMALFSSWQAMARRITHEDLSQGVRASLAPLMLVLTLVAWAALLILAFGLLFWADRGNFSPPFTGFGDAVYASGSAFSTLGINGHVSGNLTRLAVLVCSVSGLAIVTVVATFLISIQAAFGVRETLVLRLESHVTVPPAGIAILETYGNERITGRLGAFFSDWEMWAAEITITHRAFPILTFFRSNDARCEWLAALGAVMDAAALLDANVPDAPAEARAGAHFLLRTGARTLRQLGGQFKVAVEDQPHLADPARFDIHRVKLSDAGYVLNADKAEALERYRATRKTYAPNLSALARRLHIQVDEREAQEDDSRPVTEEGL